MPRYLTSALAAAAAGLGALAAGPATAQTAPSQALPAAPASGAPMLGGLSIVAVDPDVGHSASDHFALGAHVITDSLTSGVGFTDENAVQIDLRIDNGQAVFGGGTIAKKTFLPLMLSLRAVGSGQRIGFGEDITCFGMSDCAAESENVTYGNGPIAGDEGEDLTVVNYVRQQGYLVNTTITSVAAPSQCDTTVTQDVTASQAPQAVAVAATAGCRPGDWVILNAEAATSLPDQSPMQITAVGAGALTGVFNINLRKGQQITPAGVIQVASAAAFGQDRVLVDHSRASYGAGAVTAISGGDFIASGSAWSDGMVGGSALNPGCIMLDADAYTGAPFGPGAAALNSWYEIQRVSSPSRLTIFTTSIAGDHSYRGRGPGAGGYVIAPCARIMRVIGDTVILNSSRFAWAPHDAVEEAITPYADSIGYQLEMGAYTNGVTLRGGYALTNVGARTMSQGILLQTNMPPGPDTDRYAWTIGVAIQNPEVGVVQFGGRGAYAAEGVTEQGFAALSPQGALASGAGLFVGNFAYGAQLTGAGGQALDITNSASGLGLQVPWPAFTANRTISFPDQSGVVALSLAGTTGSIGGEPLAAGGCASGQVAIAGATTAMVAQVSAGGGVDPGPGFMPKAYVSAPGTVTVAVCALAAGTPAPTTYNVRVLQ